MTFSLSPKKWGNLALIALCLLGASPSFSQCPGCVVDQGCTANPAAPTLCPSSLPDGTQGSPYNQDLTFYMPAQFLVSGFNVTLDSIKVDNVSGLPAGLSWETSASPQNVFYPTSNPPATERGCVKICGTPTAFGSYNMVVNVTANVNTPIGNISQAESFSLPILILPPSGGNSSFTFSPALGCEPMEVTFQSILTPNGFQLLTHDWNFGNGSTANGPTPPSVTYSTAGDYYPELTSKYYNYVVTELSVSVTGSACCGDLDEFFGLGSPDVFFDWNNGSGTQSTASISDDDQPTFSGLNIVLSGPSLTLDFFDEDALTANDPLGQAIVNITGVGNYSFSTSELSGSLTVDTVFAFQLVGNDTITVFSTPNAPVISPAGPLSICSGETQTITIPASANSISWYQNDSTLLIGETTPSLDVTLTGNYTAVATNANGCTAESTPVFVDVLPSPPVPVISQNGGMLQTSAIGILQWFLNGNPIPGATLQTLVYGDSGTYSVQITAANGCTSAGVLFVPNPSSLNESGFAGIKISPNPVKDQIMISGLPAGLTFISIADLQGRLIMETSLSVNQGVFSLNLPSDLAEGMYVIQAKKSTGEIFISRFLKN
jgi:hypothetical protein